MSQITRLEMTPEQRELWAKLQSFELDSAGASLPFSKRLARDNGWSDEFAGRVIEEYKRFVWLAMSAGHPVTPSDEVDQAWHEHLCYTRSYWDEMCGEILGAPLHHGPTRGGRDEGRKFETWYQKTLDSYRRFFGEDAPRDIWPPSEIRFGEAPHFCRINTRRVWMIPKPALPKIPSVKVPQIGLPKRDWLRLLPLPAALFLAGCAELQKQGPNVLDWHGGPFLWFFWTLCALGLGFSFWRKDAGRLPNDTEFPMKPPSAFHIARLRGENASAVDVAIAVLLRKGALEITPEQKLRATGAAVSLSDFEAAVLGHVNASALTPGENTVRAVRQGVSTELKRLDDDLRATGLLVSREIGQSAGNWPCAITFVLFALGAAKVVVGLNRGRPVGFLIVSCVVLLFVFAYFATYSSRRSRRGDAYLAHLQSSVPKFAPQNNDFDAVALQWALIGMAAYPPEMQRVMRPPSSGDSGGSGCSFSSDSGGGDGGGGDGGGGCGGCGGCGGGGD